MKTIQFSSLAALVFCCALTTSAQTWTQTSAPASGWVSIACSADGTKVAALPVGGAVFYISTNSGATWRTNNLRPGISFSCFAISADGNQLVGAKNNSPSAIDTSADQGVSWINRTNYNDFFWRSAASSSDGKTLALAESSSYVYLSTNSGAIWGKSTHLPYNINGAFATISAAGDRLCIAVTLQGFCFTTNLGVSWTTNGPLGYWKSIASSADGGQLFAVAGSSTFLPSGVRQAIYSSKDYGTTWVSNNAPSLNWSSIACSSDGNKLIATALGGGIYSSTNGGIDWISNSVPITNWVSVASSADGTKLYAIANNTPAYLSLPGAGGIWISQTAPAPTLNLAKANDNLAVSWIIPSTNFILQQSADLTGWSDVTNMPVLNFSNLQNQVTLPLTISNSFYRLKTP